MVCLNHFLEPLDQKSQNLHQRLFKQLQGYISQIKMIAPSCSLDSSLGKHATLWLEQGNGKDLITKNVENSLLDIDFLKRIQYVKLVS